MAEKAIKKLLRAMLGEVQTLEDTFQSLIINRRIDTAVGAQLDILGKLVGRRRYGTLDDETYRRHVRAQIATNKSDGLVEDLIAIADLIVYDDDATYRVINWGTGGVSLRVEGIAITYALASTLISFLRRAVSGGVRIVLEFNTLPASETFSLEGGEGPGLGFTVDSAVGGGLASAIE